MDELCDAYVDPMSGMNPCARIQRDSRCLVDDTMSLHETMEKALWSDGPDAIVMRGKICECSCWADIIDVYTPLFEQWENYDTGAQGVGPRLQTLQTMCAQDVVGTFETAAIGESNGAQCAVNTMSLTIVPSLDLPVGATLTVTGLNAELAEPTLMVESVPAGYVVPTAMWTMPQCTKWCSMVGLCPSDGSATDDSCLAVRYDLAIGDTTDDRCMRWCDKNSHIVITTTDDVDAQSSLVITFKLLNPTFSTNAGDVFVELSAAGVYIAPTKLTATVADGVGPNNALVQTVLAASIPPKFDVLTVTESACPGAYESSTNKWVGSCAGMVNRFTVDMTPNVDLLPGARISISGQTRTGDNLFPAPMLIDAPNFQVDNWDSPAGALTLRVTQDVLQAKQSTSVVLEATMPQTADVPGVVKPTVNISAPRAGQGLSCTFQETQSASGPALIARKPEVFSFVEKTVSMERCSPGECNTITLSLVVNTALDESQGDVMFEINGFMGMERSIGCMPQGCSDDGASIVIEDAVAGGSLSCGCLLRTCALRADPAGPRGRRGSSCRAPPRALC